MENDDHTTEFYGGKNLKPVLGCDNFFDDVTEYLDVPEPIFNKAQSRPLSIDAIARQVADNFRVSGIPFWSRRAGGQ